MEHNKEFLKLLAEAIKYCCEDLKISPPKIKPINNDSYASKHQSYAGYEPTSKTIYIVMYNRTLADSTRSLMHEIAHHNQNVTGQLTQGAGKDGDQFENEANAYAGKMMRKWGKLHPEIFNMKYDKVITEENKILITRRSPEERKKNFLAATNKKIQEYIKNGSKGDLDLSNTPITSLPNNLIKIGGSLFLNGTPIASLPVGLTVGGHLDLYGTPIISLPDDLTVGKELDLNGCNNFTTISKNLVVGGYLYLDGTKIASFPSDLKVEGNINLSGTPLSQKYTKEQIKQMVPGVKGGIYT